MVTVRCNISPRASLYVTEDIDIDTAPAVVSANSPQLSTPVCSRAASASPHHTTYVIEDVTSDNKEDLYGASISASEEFLYCPKCTRPYPQNRHNEFVEHFELCSKGSK